MHQVPPQRSVAWRSAGSRRRPPVIPTRPLLWALACLALLAPARSATAADPDLPVLADIVIEGNTKTDAGLIRRVIGLRPGDPFDEDRFDEIWDRLEELGYFSYVDMDYEENDDGEIVLQVMVEEDRTTQILPLIDYDRRHKYLLGILVSDTNLRGRGERLDVSASWYRAHRYRIAWHRPWLLDRRDLELRVAGGWEQAGFVYRPTDYTLWDAGLRLRWYALGPVYLEAGAAYGGFEQRDTFTELDPDRGAGSAGPVTRPAGWRDRLTWTATLGLDTRDNSYYATRGGFHRLQLRQVEGRGFAGYGEWSADLRQFLPVPWGHILALHAWGRVVNNPVPFEDRSYWGGPETLRGYDYASLEGEDGYLLSLEYRWPLFLMPISHSGRVIGIGLHLFADAGDTWYDGDEPGAARVGWGGGVHLNISSRQFRFEVARTEEGDTAFQFADAFNF
jgi:outer membrane protein assembly factor BamA